MYIYTIFRQLQEKAVEQQRSLYIVFVDFSKAFDTVNRWDTLEGPQSLWLSWVIYQYDQTVPWWHDRQSVYWRWYQWCLSYQSWSETGLCSGSTLFTLYLGAVLEIMSANLASGIYIQTCSDGKLFNLACLKAEIRTNTLCVRELLYADDWL